MSVKFVPVGATDNKSALLLLRQNDGFSSFAGSVFSTEFRIIVPNVICWRFWLVQLLRREDISKLLSHHLH